MTSYPDKADRDGFEERGSSGRHAPLLGEQLEIAQRIARETLDADDRALEVDASSAFRSR